MRTKNEKSGGEGRRSWPDLCGSAVRELLDDGDERAFEDTNSEWILNVHRKNVESFLKRRSERGLKDLIALAESTRNKLREKLDHYNTEDNDRDRILRSFSECCALVLIKKLESVINDYKASGTDFNLASGRLWAAQNKCADYLGLIYGIEAQDSLSLICPGCEEALMRAFDIGSWQA